jgi:hypothetical protein
LQQGSGGSPCKVDLWNAVNKLPATMVTRATAGSWVYDTNTYRQVQASTAHQIEICYGLSQDPVWLSGCGLVSCSNAAAGAQAGIAIGVNSTTTPETLCLRQYNTCNAAQGAVGLHTSLQHIPVSGNNTYVWLEIGTSFATTTFYSASTANLSGVQALVWW